MNVLRRQVTNERAFALWVAIDEDMKESGKPLSDCVAGVMTLALHYDEVGQPVTFITRGWVRRGYHAEPLDRALPFVEQWARARGCVSIKSQTERSSAACAEDRLSLASVKARLRAMAAYWTWINKRGFTMRETVFERKL